MDTYKHLFNISSQFATTHAPHPPHVCAHTHTKYVCENLLVVLKLFQTYEQVEEWSEVILTGDQQRCEHI
jgi:hypothetical protein